MPIRPAFLILTTSLFLSACGAPGLLLGAGATAGVVGLQERPAGQTVSDTRLKVQIKQMLAEQDAGTLSDIGIDVYYGDVLITGILPSTTQGDRIVAAVRRVIGVNKVYNELFLGSVYTTGQKAKDAWISARISPLLLTDSHAYPLNYLTTVVNGHVYVFGAARTEGERDHVVHLLSTVSGVRQVHDYLRIGVPARP